ncbi:MAG: Gldg family protein, partial [Flexibacteraceae bacterium]
FKEKGYNGKVLVVADGDFVRNDFSTRTGQTYPLGFDRFAQVQFANKEFVMNCLNYMLDEKGLIVAKSKDIKLRPLDRPRIAKQKGTWQFANIAVPVIIILIFGAVRLNIRKRRFTRFNK